MNAAEIVEAFEQRLLANPSLAPIAVAIGPYRAVMGDPAQVVAILDGLVYEYGQARGLVIYAREGQ